MRQTDTRRRGPHRSLRGAVHVEGAPELTKHGASQLSGQRLAPHQRGQLAAVVVPCLAGLGLGSCQQHPPRRWRGLHRVDLLRLHQRRQRVGVTRGLFGRYHEPAAHPRRKEQFERRDVEAHGGDGAHTRGLVRASELRHGAEKIDQAALRHLHTLGASGRSRSEQHIRQVVGGTMCQGAQLLQLVLLGVGVSVCSSVLIGVIDQHRGQVRERLCVTARVLRGRVGAGSRNRGAGSDLDAMHEPLGV
mmetsp:Transcript_15415/g.37900  ORF Transcript_15415/g.37900 Transcript_15415/m.37900 type:complete len:247 (-) Transcript_15415:1284-2024(-)